MSQSHLALTKNSNPVRFRTHLEGLQDEFEIMIQEIEALKKERDQYKAEVNAHAEELKHVRRQIGCERCQGKNMRASQLIVPFQPKFTRIGSSLLSRLLSQSNFLDKLNTLQCVIPSDQTGGSAQFHLLQEHPSPVEPSRLPELELHTKSLSTDTTIANFVPSSLQLPTLAIDPNADAKKHEWSITFNDQVRKELEVELAYSFFHENGICSVKFSHDGKFLAAGCWDGKACVYDVQTGILTSVLRNLFAKNDIISAVCFSRDGKYLATASNDNYIYIWEIKTKYMRNTFKGHTKSIHTLCFSPNGRLLLSASWDHTTRLWNMRYGSTMVLTVDKSSDYYGFPSAAFSPNGRYIAASCNDGQVRIWDAYTGRLIRRFMANGALCDIAVMPDGSGLLSGGLGQTVMYWDISSLVDTRFPASPRMMNHLDEHDSAVKEQTRPDRECLGHTDSVVSLAVTTDGRWVASGSYDQTVRIWDTRAAAMQYTLNNGDWIRSVDFSPTGSFLAVGGYKGTLRIWRYSSIRGVSDARPFCPYDQDDVVAGG